MIKESVTVLGSTGSIGCNTLDVLSRYPKRYQIFALTAHDNIVLLAEQCRIFEPKYAVISNRDRAAELRSACAGLKTKVLEDTGSLIQVASDHEVDTVIAGIVGIAGLGPTLAAARSGKRILLANKEALIVAGRLFMQTVRDNNAVIVPVDSEHNGIFQCLEKKHQSVNIARVKKIILTASGGPFLHFPYEQLRAVTPAQACKHPNWKMGAKISVDSATLLNKGLEVIEAHWLFDIPMERIEVLVHPQSIVHGLVMFEDGSMIAQMSRPDMRIAIAYALSGSKRIDSGVAPLDLAECSRLDFLAVDHHRFPCMQMTADAFSRGETQIIALNAANEVAVAGFLEGHLRFDLIPDIIHGTFTQIKTRDISNLETIQAIDTEARVLAQKLIADRQSR